MLSISPPQNTGMYGKLENSTEARQASGGGGAMFGRSNILRSQFVPAVVFPSRIL